MSDELAVDLALILGLLAEHGPLRGSGFHDAAEVSWPASRDDEDRSPWLAQAKVRKLILLGLVRYVPETDRYALTSAGYRSLPPAE